MSNATDISGYEYRGQLYCSEHIMAALPTGEGQEFDGWKLADGISMPVEQNLDEIAASFWFATDRATISSQDFPKTITAGQMADDSFCAVCQRELDICEPPTLLGSLLDFDGVASFDAGELGLEDLGIVSLVDVSKSEDNPGQLLVSVYVSENLSFHADRNPALFTREDSGDDWEPTEAAWAGIAPLLAARYAAENVVTEGGTIRFDLSLLVSESLPLDQLGATIWEQTKLVQFSNETDPGTFGSPYLFGSLLSEAMEAGKADAS